MEPWVLVAIPAAAGIFTFLSKYTYGQQQWFTFDQGVSRFGWSLAILALVAVPLAAAGSLWNLLAWAYVPIGLLIGWKFRVYAL